MTLLILAAVSLAVTVVLGFDLARGILSLPVLHQSPRAQDPPSVTVVVAARDEAPHVARAVEAFLGQDYPGLDVVAVDDRSTDGTGDLLDRLAQHHDRLTVLHIHELPDGWLGKNHALQRGAAVARGDILLLTDADIMMEPDAVIRAVGMMEGEGLDHLAVAPRIQAGSGPATLVTTTFLSLFSSFSRPWKARDDGRWHAGIGAFNLVRSNAYRDVGGHEAIPLRPDEDLRLGRILKAAGYRQGAARGMKLMRVEWYPSLGALARGLRKNAFAAVDYRWTAIVLGTLVPLGLIFWPLAALVVTSGWVLWLNAAIVGMGLFTSTMTALGYRLPLWTGLLYPVGSFLLLWIVWAAVLRVVTTGSVEWRGTHYPLDELRSGND